MVGAPEGQETDSRHGVDGLGPGGGRTQDATKGYFVEPVDAPLEVVVAVLALPEDAGKVFVVIGQVEDRGAQGADAVFGVRAFQGRKGLGQDVKVPLENFDKQLLFGLEVSIKKLSCLEINDSWMKNI